MHAGEIPHVHIGTVAALWRYPTKALAAEPLAHVTVESDGFAGDRVTALIVRNADHVRSGKTFRGKEHALLHTVATQQAAFTIGASAGIELEPHTGGRHFDAGPISLIFDIWLNDVEALVGRGLDPLRYRPNIFARAAAGFEAREAALIGTTLALGSSALRVSATIKRCVTTTYDIATGDSDPNVLRAVAQQRGNVVGVYCTVEQTGAIARADAIAATAK